MNWVLIITFLYLGNGVAIEAIPMENGEVCALAAYTYIAAFEDRPHKNASINVHVVCVKDKK